MPLPMPFSVMSSPSQTRNIVPAAMVMRMVTVRRPVSPVKPTCMLPGSRLWIRINCPYPCSRAMGTVSQWV
ncbi:hypothetical protein HRbin24_01230 [bacterium HR24]|nr:hypothetical protein HRbin24_01230 [bacterium HR24]